MLIHYLINGLNGGGAGFPVPDLVACMRERGHRVRVLALAAQDGRAAARLDRAGIPWQVLGNGARDWWGAARALDCVLREDRPDLIWTSLTGATLYGQIAGWRRGIPVVSWQHNAFLRPGNRRALKITRALTALWVADSQTVADFTVSELGVEAEKVMQWPIFRARADALQALPAAAGARLRIGSLGRLHPNKCYHDLIEVAARLKAQQPALADRIDFVIGGSGDESLTLEMQVRARGLTNVFFAGFIEDTDGFLAGLHGYIQTSHHEGMCIAAHEAMQAGLPVIATAVGELQNSILHRHTGWLCAVGDIEALTTAVSDLASRPERAAEMGARARNRVLERYGDVAFWRSGADVLARVEALVTSEF